MKSTQDYINNRLQKLAENSNTFQKVKAYFKPYIWNVENAGKKGFNKNKGIWKTYSDQGHPAVGPGIRVNQHRTYTQSQLQDLYDKTFKTHYNRMVNNKKDYPGIKNVSPRLQAGMLSYEWTGNDYPKLYRAMLNKNWDRARREARIYEDADDKSTLLERRTNAWINYFLKQRKQRLKAESK